MKEKIQKRTVQVISSKIGQGFIESFLYFGMSCSPKLTCQLSRMKSYKSSFRNRDYTHKNIFPRYARLFNPFANLLLVIIAPSKRVGIIRVSSKFKATKRNRYVYIQLLSLHKPRQLPLAQETIAMYLGIVRKTSGYEKNTLTKPDNGDFFAVVEFNSRSRHEGLVS